MIVACLALLVALSGTGMAAATQLGRNSVGTLQLKDSAVTNARSATTRSTPRRSRRGRCFAPTSRLASFRPDRSVPGIAARRGRLEPQGLPAWSARHGPPGIGRRPGIGLDKPTPNTLWVTRTVDTSCNSGEKAMSAGTGWSADANDLELATVYMKPVVQSNGTVTGFTAKGANNARDGEDHTFTLYVLCYTG